MTNDSNNDFNNKTSLLKWLYNEVRYRFTYDPAVGELRWKHCRQKRIKPGTIAGHLPKSGYRFVILGRERYRIAQLIWLLHHGTYPARVYRLDGDPRNNRIENLYV